MHHSLYEKLPLMRHESNFIETVKSVMRLESFSTSLKQARSKKYETRINKRMHSTRVGKGGHLHIY